MNILIADDHPFVVDAFTIVFEKEFPTETLNFLKCYTCKDVFNALQNQLAQNKTFDLVLLDFSMPSYPDKKFFSGGDAAIYIKRAMPNCKIIIMTSSMHSITVFDVIQNINPDAFFYKSDYVSNDFQQILKTISDGKKYRSIGINKKYQEELDDKIWADSCNRKILHFIALGFKIKEICEELHLSEAAINKRIHKMKKFMGVKEVSGLLKEAKKRNYV